MSNTVSKDTHICCLEMLIPGIIRLYITLGVTQIQSLKWMLKT